MGNINQIKLQHTILSNILSKLDKTRKAVCQQLFKMSNTIQLNPRLIITIRTPAQTFLHFLSIYFVFIVITFEFYAKFADVRLLKMA